MIEAMKRLVAAVEAIPEEVEGWMPDALTDALIDARQAIAEAEKQEPVALMVVNGEISYKSTYDDHSFGMWCPVNYDSSHSFPDGTKFYTRPQPKREWVGLTVMEAVELDIATNHPRKFAAAIEAKLKEKNFE
jgi:hypothetical protein